MRIQQRKYSELNPANKNDYQRFVTQYVDHFKHCEDEYELERGLNHVFSADWVPSLNVIEEALKASRRMNSFSTAVRVLEGLEQKSYKKEQYQLYLKELQPLLNELGVCDKTALGEFLPYRDFNPREE